VTADASVTNSHLTQSPDPIAVSARHHARIIVSLLSFERSTLEHHRPIAKASVTESLIALPPAYAGGDT